MLPLYKHLHEANALALEIQEIFWKEIFPIRQQPMQSVKSNGTFIASILKINESEEFDFINRLQAKYPFLSKHMFVFDMPPGFATPIHLDNGPEERERINGKRLLSINIPISGCTDRCPTEFFKIAPEEIVFVRAANVSMPIEGATIELMDQYVLKDCPILVNTQVPHRVNNINNTEKRTSVSWTIKDSWEWDEVLDFFNTPQPF